MVFTRLYSDPNSIVVLGSIGGRNEHLKLKNFNDNKLREYRDGLDRHASSITTVRGGNRV